MTHDSFLIIAKPKKFTLPSINAGFASIYGVAVILDIDDFAALLPNGAPPFTPHFHSLQKYLLWQQNLIYDFIWRKQVTINKIFNK